MVVGAHFQFPKYHQSPSIDQAIVFSLICSVWMAVFLSSLFHSISVFSMSMPRCLNDSIFIVSSYLLQQITPKTHEDMSVLGDWGGRCRVQCFGDPDTSLQSILTVFRALHCSLHICPACRRRGNSTLPVQGRIRAFGLRGKREWIWYTQPSPVGCNLHTTKCSDFQVQSSFCFEMYPELSTTLIKIQNIFIIPEGLPIPICH